MEPLELRTARPEDAADLARLAEQLGYPTTAGEITTRLAALASSDLIVVAAESNRVVAWMHLGTSTSLESDPWAEIRGLVVDIERRSAGIGGRLVAFARHWAAERGVARLRVRTNVLRKDTHRFYERCGFTLTKEQRVYDMTIGD